MEWLGVSRKMSAEMGKVALRNHQAALFTLVFDGSCCASELPQRSTGCVKSWPFLAGFSPFGDSMTSISHPDLACLMSY